MNDRFFPELARRLKREDIAIGEVEDNRLPVLLDGQAAMASSQAPYPSPRRKRQGSLIALHLLSTSNPLRWASMWFFFRATDQTDGAPREPSAAGHAGRGGARERTQFSPQAETELSGLCPDEVLAGREMAGGLGYEFATWWYTYDRTGVTQGNYHYDYDAAKLDFACRSGLVEKNRTDGAPAKAPFSFRGERRGKGVQCGMPEGRSTRNGLCLDDEQLTELYRCIAETLDSGYPMTEEREKTLKSAMEQIDASVDDLEERVSLSNQRELEAAEQQANSEPGMEMAP